MLHESMYFAPAGRPPTDEETAASMDLPLTTFLSLRRQARHARERRLSALSDVGADRRHSPDDYSIQEETSPERQRGIEHGDAARLAAHELLETGRGLSRREHAILIGCYRQGRTLNSVARDLRLTKQRVHQIRRQLLARLAVCLASPRALRRDQVACAPSITRSNRAWRPISSWPSWATA